MTQLPETTPPYRAPVRLFMAGLLVLGVLAVFAAVALPGGGGRDRGESSTRTAPLLLPPSLVEVLESGPADEPETALSGDALDDADGDHGAPETDGAVLDEDDVTDDGAGEQAVSPAPASTPAPAPVARPLADASGMRLEIPRIGVQSASVREMGFDRTSGEMQVPPDASLVAWYGFTAQPGQPGNAVFAAHVNWSGRLGVFANLHRLERGDEVTVAVDGQRLRYRVTEAYLVRPDEADMASIIGRRSGPQTLTLITCGGEYIPSARAYERRVIVHAELIESRAASGLDGA